MSPPYDAKDGKELWRTYTIPGEGEPGHDTWQGEDWKNGGGSAWMTGNYDKDTKTIYWGVGNAAPWPGEMHPGDNLYTSSVLALDPNTGKIKTYHQYHQNDSWDWDEVEAPMLIDLQRDGRNIKSLVHPGRDAIFWILERTPTKINYVAGWPFVSTDVWKGIDAESGRPIVDPAHKPMVGKRVEFCPSLWGGKDWPSAAYSQKTGLVYVPANENFCGGFTGEKVPLKPGELWLGTKPEDIGLKTKPGADHFGELQAWDPVTGKKMWQHNFPKSQLFGSVTATAGDLVFVGGTNDRNFRAFNAKSGELLWEQKTNSGIMGMPVSYEIDGTQYIAIQSGWGRGCAAHPGCPRDQQYRHRSQRAAGRRDLGVRAEEIGPAGGSKEAECQGANAADGNVRRILRGRCPFFPCGRRWREAPDEGFYPRVSMCGPAQAYPPPTRDRGNWRRCPLPQGKRAHRCASAKK
ncbi:PQQ-dependent dehydrogenase (methanol/ethanol family) [Bradyrhizobium sp. GM22.5]